MSTSAQLGGIHPRSEQLIELTRSYDRGKTDRAAVERQLEHDIQGLLRLQEESGFDNFSDGAFYWQDQLRPIVESLDGITTGTRYDRWFDTNTFYKKPTANGRIHLGNFEIGNFIRNGLLPKTKAWKVTVVGPYTFSELTENLHYQNQSELVSDLAKAEHDIIARLNAAGVSEFQISEPCLVYQPYREAGLGKKELDVAFTALRETIKGIRASFTIQTFFGDATSILPTLLELPVDAVGFDLFETDYSNLRLKTEKKIALGIVDSRESNVEAPDWIAETVTRASEHIITERIVIVPNSDLKFVPRKVADAKARALAEAARSTEEAR